MGDAHGLGIGMEARKEDSDLLQQDEGNQTGVPLIPFQSPTYPSGRDLVSVIHCCIINNTKPSGVKLQ